MVAVKEKRDDLYTITYTLLSNPELRGKGLASPIKDALVSAQSLVDPENPYVKDVYRTFQETNKENKGSVTAHSLVNNQIVNEFVDVLAKTKGPEAANKQLAEITKQLQKQLEQSQKTTSDLGSITTRASSKEKINDPLESGTKPTMGPKR